VAQRERGTEMLGTVVNWRGRYGFIRPASGRGENVFFHESAIAGTQQVTEGTQVEYSVGPGRDGQIQAVRVRLIQAGSKPEAT
jgi:cold shock CspA family protein